MTDEPATFACQACAGRGWVRDNETHEPYRCPLCHDPATHGETWRDAPSVLRYHSLPAHVVIEIQVIGAYMYVVTIKETDGFESTATHDTEQLNELLRRHQHDSTLVRMVKNE